MGGGNYEDISTHSIESMVAIEHAQSDDQSILEQEDRRYMLLYSKSKVYIHPTAYARDNIPGFVAIVRKDAIKPQHYVAWIPESLLEQRGQEEWDKFHKVEVASPKEDDDAVLVDLPERHGESYAFSVPISAIYSLLVYPPSFSSWYGSIAIHLSAGETQPTLYFHDDESRSFTGASPGSPRQQHSAWGGEDLLQRLRTYANLLRSSLQSSLFLVNPSRADIETHTVILYADDAVDEILNPSTSLPRNRLFPGANGHNRRTSVLHQTLAPPSPGSQARIAFLQGFSNITKGARSTAQRILSHPLAKPIVPHLPDPVKSLVSANGEWASWVEKGGVGEFESARVYLARWARIVAEEGERARQREVRTMGMSGDEEEDGGLGVFEVLKQRANLPTPKSTRNPKNPIDKETWSNWFAGDGRPLVTQEYMRQEVFRRGLEPSVRKKAWPFILDVLPWDADEREREIIWSQRRIQYRDLKADWFGVDEIFNREDILEERHRIDVDCRRTDRTQPLFIASSPSPSTPGGTPGPSQTTHRSKFSPANDEIGAQSQANEHVEKLCEILLTYELYEKNLGYVQGMSDLCAPIYVVTGADEVMTFWCFVSVMERMKQNFLRDQSGMKKQLATLQQLLVVMDPELYRHLEKTDSLNLFFCFRWVLISFKREFPFDDVLRLWEVLWTGYYSKSFVLFVALAVMESHRDVVMRYLVEFDEILKYCNELSMTIDLDSTLAQAEVLYLSFHQVVADIDRRAAEQRPDIRRRAGKGPAGAQSDSIPVSKLPIISEDLRALLVSGK